MRKNVSISLDDKTLRQIRSKLALEGISFSAWVRLIAEEKLLTVPILAPHLSAIDTSPKEVQNLS